MKGFNSRSKTNSFSYRNSQMYAPFYKMEMGTSFYNLSVPQYSNTTYNSLAYQGAGIASNSRLGRYQRTNNIPPTSFVPPVVTPPLAIANTAFLLSPNDGVNVVGGLIITTMNISINPQDPINNYTITSWPATGDLINTVTAEEPDTTKFSGGNAIIFSGIQSTNPAHISQNLTGTMIYNANYSLNIWIRSDSYSNIINENLGIHIYLNNTLIANQINIGYDWNNYNITLTSTTQLINPTMKIQFINNDVLMNSHSVYIAKPTISQII